jgi:hypothetical protein
MLDYSDFYSHVSPAGDDLSERMGPKFKNNPANQTFFFAP